MAAALDDIQKFLNWRKKFADIQTTCQESIKADPRVLSKYKTEIQTFSTEALHEYEKSKMKANSVWQFFNHFTSIRISGLSKAIDDLTPLLTALRILIEALDLSLFCHNLSKSDAELFIISIGSNQDTSAQCPTYAKALSTIKRIEVINFDYFSNGTPENYLGEMPVNNLTVYRYNAYFGCANKLLLDAAELEYVKIFRHILTKANKKIIFQQFTGPYSVGKVAIQLAQDYPNKVDSQLEIISGYFCNQPVIHYSKEFIDSVSVKKQGSHSNKKDYEDMQKAWDKARAEAISHPDYRKFSYIEHDKLFDEKASAIYYEVEPLFRSLGVMYRTIDLIPEEVLFKRSHDISLHAPSKMNSKPEHPPSSPPLLLSKSKNADNIAFFELRKRIGKTSEYNKLKKEHDEALTTFNDALDVHSLQTLQLSIGNLKIFYESFLCGWENFDAILKNFIKTLEEVDKNALEKIASSLKFKG